MESNAVDQVPLCVDDNEESGKAAVKGYPPESVPQSDIISEEVFCHRADNNIKSIKFNVGNHTDHSLKPKSAYKVDSFVPIQNSLSALHTCPTNDLVNMNSPTPDINQESSSTTEVGNFLATSLDNNSCLVSNCVLPIQNSRTTCDNTRQYNCDSRGKVVAYDKYTTSPTIELDDSIPPSNCEDRTPNLHHVSNLDNACPISSNDTSPNDRETNCTLPSDVISETCSVNNTEHNHNQIQTFDIKTEMQNSSENNDLQIETKTDLKNEPFRNAANEEKEESIETDCSKECTDAEDLQLKADVIENQMSLSSSLDVIIEEMEELQGLLEVDVHKEDTNSLKGIDEVLDEIDIDNMSESYGYISDECEHIETTVVINDTDISTDIEPTSSSELIDSEILPKDLTPNIKVNHIAYEEDDNTYQEDTASVKLLHQSECSNQIYCETSFGKSDIDCEISEWKSKHRLSRSSKARKVSLEQRLKRRFTINDEHKHEVAKRIIALVIKYSLFVFNFCSWVIASVIIGIGLWLLTDKGRIATEGTDFFLDPSIMICTVGGITFVVALLGCVGALRENLLLLKVFFLVLAIIVVVELIIAITIFVMYTVPSVKDKFLRSTPENILRTAIQKYMDDSKLKIWIDLIQQEFRCCGIGGGEADEGFRDWQINAYYNCTPSNKSIYRCAVPTSCCIFEKGDRVNIMCGFGMSNKPIIEVRDYIFTRGCIHGFGEWLGQHDELIVIAALSTMVMQFLAVVSAKMMIRRIVKTRRRWSSLIRSTSSLSSG